MAKWNNNAAAIRCGVIDCFSEDNFFGFKKDKISYFDNFKALVEAYSYEDCLARRAA